MKNKSSVLVISAILISVIATAENGAGGNSKGDSFTSLIIPAFIAAAGYILKTVYEAIMERKKEKRTLLEEKLKNFYWPILTRLEENDAIWRLILVKRNEKGLSEVEQAIADYTENDIILKNHREIMKIIMDYRYLAKFDETLSNCLREYFKHVAFYEGILKSKAHIFPANIGAPYPKDFGDIIKDRTETLQKRLDRKGLFG